MIASNHFLRYLINHNLTIVEHLDTVECFEILASLKGIGVLSRQRYRDGKVSITRENPGNACSELLVKRKRYVLLQCSLVIYR